MLKARVHSAPMNTQTERYIRADSQWVKITRNASKRTFCLARGWSGEVTANDVRTYSFKYLPTWADAQALAKQKIADHK